MSLRDFLLQILELGQRVHIERLLVQYDLKFHNPEQPHHLQPYVKFGLYPASAFQLTFTPNHLAVVLQILTCTASQEKLLFEAAYEKGLWEEYRSLLALGDMKTAGSGWLTLYYFGQVYAAKKLVQTVNPSDLHWITKLYGQDPTLWVNLLAWNALPQCFFAIKPWDTLGEHGRSPVGLAYLPTKVDLWARTILTLPHKSNSKEVYPLMQTLAMPAETGMTALLDPETPFDAYTAQLASMSDKGELYHFCESTNHAEAEFLNRVRLVVLTALDLAMRINPSEIFKAAKQETEKLSKPAPTTLDLMDLTIRVKKPS